MSTAPKLRHRFSRSPPSHPGATLFRWSPSWDLRPRENPRWACSLPGNWAGKCWPAIRRKSIAGSTSARPSPRVDERAGVPHHLLDLVDPDFPFTAGEYRSRAVAVLEDLRQRVAAADSDGGHRASICARCSRAWPTPRRARKNCARAWKRARTRTACNICIACCGASIPKRRCASARATAPR